MSALENVVSTVIKGAALVGSDQAKEALRKEACGTPMATWRSRSIAKVAGVGGLTGLTGGPWGLALEGLDLGYLFAAAGRACYGIGHILGRDVDYDADIPLIMAVWTGAGEATGTVAAGKVGVKVGGKAAAHLGAKAGAKVIAKMAFKTSTKATQKIAAKVAAKIAAKATAKLSTKWIPLIGGLVSAAINAWIADALMEAATSYYSNDYVVLSDELVGAMET